MGGQLYMNKLAKSPIFGRRLQCISSPIYHILCPLLEDLFSAPKKFEFHNLLDDWLSKTPFSARSDWCGFSFYGIGWVIRLQLILRGLSPIEGWGNPIGDEERKSVKQVEFLGCKTSKPSVWRCSNIWADSGHSQLWSKNSFELFIGVPLPPFWRLHTQFNYVPLPNLKK